MEPAVDLFVMAALASVTGSLYFLCWLAVKPLLDRNGLVGTALRLLYVALALFTVPVLYWAIRRMSLGKDGAIEGVFLLPTPDILRWTQLAGWIWLCGMAVLFLYYGYGIYGGKRLIRYSRPCQQQVEQRLAACQSRLRFFRPVRVRWSPYLKQPMVQGCFRCTICLPDPRRYTGEELELILLHELIHCRRHDVLMKHLLAVIRCIHWWNPCAFWLVREAGKWIEARCDQEVWLHVPEGQMPVYYRLLIQVSAQENQPAGLTAGFWERKSYLKTRIRRMEQNRRRDKRSRARGLLVASGAVLLLGLLTTVTALAAGEAVQAGYEALYERTAVVQLEEPSVSFLEENWSKLEAAPDILVQEAPVSDETAGSGPVSFQWQMPAGVRMQTPPLSLEAGATVLLQVSDAGNGSSFQAGLITPDGYRQFVQGEENLSHSFSLSSAGEYRIFVENAGEETIQVDGFYQIQSPP